MNLKKNLIFFKEELFMNLEEKKNLKYKVEQKIMDLVIEFQEQTGLTVTGVTFYKAHTSKKGLKDNRTCMSNN